MTGERVYLRLSPANRLRIDALVHRLDPSQWLLFYVEMVRILPLSDLQELDSAARRNAPLVVIEE